MTKLSFNARRVITYIAGLPFALCAINWIVGWHWFGRYDRGAVALCLVFFIPFAYFVAPSSSEMRDHNERKKLGDDR